MEIVFNALYKLDIEKNTITELPIPTGKNDLRSYIVQLLDKIIENPNNKGFKFRSETTEVAVVVDKIANSKNELEYLPLSKTLADRLLYSEIESDRRNNLNVDLLKGIVVISLVRHENKTAKVIISKADYNEYLDAQTYVNRDGIPLKKKIYKAFVADFDDKLKIVRTSVFDTNPGFTVYWWREFLELEEIFTDEHNTESVFNVIEKKILTPLRKKHKSDYLTLWNATVHYFKTKQSFSVDDFIENILENYSPFDDDVKPKELIKTVETSLSKGKFDTKFNIDAKIISKKFKKSIPLTPQIDLNLKSDIQNLENTIMRYQETNGDKWVMIKSPEGFEYFGETKIMP